MVPSANTDVTPDIPTDKDNRRSDLRYLRSWRRATRDSFLATYTEVRKIFYGRRHNQARNMPDIGFHNIVGAALIS